MPKSGGLRWWGRAGGNLGREGTESISGEWEHGGHSRAGEEEGRGHKFLGGKSYWRKHLGFSFQAWRFHKKTVQETQIWASSALLLPELLFPFSLWNVGVSLDLLTLISYLRTTRLAGRHLEERGSASQMARQKHQS